jgi:SAM-dependent methyltransferase
MKITLKKIVKCFIPYGILVLYRRICRTATQNPPEMTWMEFTGDYKKIMEQKQASPGRDDFVFGKRWPILGEKYSNNGSATGDYFHQDLLVAGRIYENKPEKHIDVGSRIDGFVAHVASFREITVIDIRPSTGRTHNITFLQQDFMSELDVSLIESCDSASSLHAMEHFGLGRYGDPVNYDGHLTGLNNLYKLLKKKGKLYFSVPIGCPQRIEFNAHRVFSPKYLLKQFNGKYQIDFVSYVDGAGDLHENVDINDFKENYKDNYGCGIFELTKL